MKAVLTPAVDALKSVFAALTGVMMTPLRMLQSMMESLRDPAIADNVQKIAAAIDEIPTHKAVAIMATAGAEPSKKRRVQHNDPEVCVRFRILCTLSER